VSMRLVVLASGRGSNLQAIIDACARGTLDAHVAGVVSDQPGAAALERASAARIRAVAVPRANYGSRSRWEEALAEVVASLNPHLVVLAGFMRILSPVFIERFGGNVINIHPSLLPSFPGLEAQKQALDRGVKYSGCTVHFVDSGCDTGPIIAQRVVPVLEGDDVESLSSRILEQEHELLVEVLRDFAARWNEQHGEGSQWQSRGL
jgi:phosphoribosylglycinamide formyltransferase-1